MLYKGKKNIGLRNMNSCKLQLLQHLMETKMHKYTASHFQQQFYLLVYMNISLPTLSIGEVEEVICIVPWQLVDLKLELLLVADLLATDIYEWHQVLFVPNCNCLTIWRPCDVDVLTWKINWIQKKTITIKIYK